MSAPRVLHFHDCADVGGALVRAAGRQSLSWDYLSAEAVRPPDRPTGFLSARAYNLLLSAKLRPRVARAEVLHIHYGTAVRDAARAGLGSKPYFLHLHGTDIRRHWVEGGRRNSTIQTYIDRAVGVFYTSLDTRENAEAARADAQFMPAFIEPDRLAAWVPDTSQPPKIVFLSRWEAIKGLERQLDLVRELRAALPEVQLEGLDWGYGAADAAKLGVRLVPKMPHAEYVRWIGGATAAVGQAQPMFGVSEFEAMAMGVPVAAVGTRIPRPDNGFVPPVIEGSPEDVVAQLRSALADPLAASQALSGRDWALGNHVPDPYIAPLQDAYIEAVA